ncbi:MAG: PadR family transcriptional regulator [Actinomycetota bacterium]|nr:PadR family transcriptional regulator [Actinomycetota bacterium]
MTQRTLNATAASLLGFLHSGPSSGWDLLITARRRIGPFWSITQSQVYRELAAMERAGLITAHQSGPRDRRPYELTGAGRAAFARWLAREPSPEQIRFPLLLTMSFGAHLSSETLAEFVESHRRTHVERLAEYESAREALNEAMQAGMADAYGFATLDFGIRYERAVLEWFEHLPARIREGREPADDAAGTRG